MTQKKSLTESWILSRTNKAYPRCHLEFTTGYRALSGIPTYPRQLTYAPTLQNTLCEYDTFDCTLSGPFDDLYFHPTLSTTGSLWNHNHRYLRFNGLN